MAKIRILIAHDHAILRAGLRLLINSQQDMEVVGEAKDGPETLRQAAARHPDLVTLDLAMPGIRGVKVIEQLRRTCPQARVLVVTMHDEPALARAVLMSGGSGYLNRTATENDLMTAIRDIHRGRICAHVDADNQREARPAPTVKPARLLSRRESEVFQLLAQGHINREIADKLLISVKTIETHRARLMEKLGLRSRAELVRYALTAGILALPDPIGTDRAM
jgi:two-component system, NarL family, response regulator NreC